MSVPISLRGNPPSLLGNAAIPKKQEEYPPKQRRLRRTKKKSKPKDEGGLYLSPHKEIDKMEIVKPAHGLIVSPTTEYKTRIETRAAASSETPSDSDEDANYISNFFSLVDGQNSAETKSTTSFPWYEVELLKESMIQPAPSLIAPRTPDSQTTNKDFTFIEDPTETDADKSETIPTASSETPTYSDEDSISESGTTGSDSDEDEYCFDLVINRRLYKLPCAHGLINNTFRASAKKNVLKQLREVFDKEPTTEKVLEIADSIGFLRIMGASNPVLDDIGRKARKGARLYEEGLKAMTEAQDLLRSCANEISLLK